MNSKRRSFNQSERNALWIAADGKCQECREVLDETWEPDHVHPYSKGGESEILNGQALCRNCNRKKGAHTLATKKSLELRHFQEAFIATAIERAKAGKKYLICNVCPGSGKTLASQAAADRLMAEGYINQVVILVPRINLAIQYELDWKEMGDLLPWQRTMQGLHHINNTLPLLYKDASGYITTYASLCFNPQIHLQQISKKRTLLILDEAHQLGIDENGGDTTQSAKWVEEAGKRAEMVFVMSGTPYRTDGNPLLFAHPDFYGEIDKETGRARLLPDLEATYRDGVRDEYLRRFEYVLVDGGYTWVDIDGGEQEQNLKSGVASVYKAVNLEGIWQPLVDKFVERLEEQKSLVHNGLAGLIATGHQRQAKEVEQYLKTNYPHLKILTAVSDDGEKALQALRLFKEGKHDVLVTG